MKRILIFLISLGIFISCKKAPEQKAEVKKFGSLEGVILSESGQPISGAFVEISNSSVSSGSDGKYSFNNLSVNEYSVTVSRQYYLSKTQNVKITENNTSKLDFVLSKGEPHLTISDTIININGNAGSFDIKIASNSSWTIKNSSSWLTCLKRNGDGDNTVGFSHSENTNVTDRRDTVEFASGTIKRKLIVTQYAPILLLSYEGILGTRGLIDAPDTVYLKFNKSIKIESIKVLTPNSYPNADPIIYFDNDRGVKFDYPLRLGGSFSFAVSANDGKGNYFRKDLDIKLYKSKFDISGTITDYLYVNNDKEVLISAYAPSRIYRYSIEQNVILQTFDLSNYIAPVEMVHNPYDSKIYIMGTNSTNNIVEHQMDLPDVYTLDLNTGQIVKAFTIPKEASDGNYPVNIPYHMAFTKTGMGIILLKSLTTSALRWKLIDCTDNNKITYPVGDGMQSYYFSDIEATYDYSKLILVQQAIGSTNYGIFDGSTLKLSMLQPNVNIGRSHFVVPNRKNETIFFEQVSQFIMDLKGNLSKISYMVGAQPSANFSYRPNEDHIVYWYNQDSSGSPPRFVVLNYNSGLSIKDMDCIDLLKKMTTTINGKYVLAYKSNPGEGTGTGFYVFEVESFKTW